jgi:glutaredoxin
VKISKKYIQRVIEEELKKVIAEGPISPVPPAVPLDLSPPPGRGAPTPVAELWQFSASYCPPCRRAKAWLEKNNIKFKYINIMDRWDLAAAEDVIKIAFPEGIPTIPKFAIVMTMAARGGIRISNAFEIKPKRTETFEVFLVRIVKEYSIPKLEEKPGHYEPNPAGTVGEKKRNF